MNPEQQRIKIAEASGWKFVINPVTKIGGYWERGQQGTEGYERGDWGSRECLVGIPDYLSDLNAMHEAEKVLIGHEQLMEYTGQLQRALCRSDKDDNWNPVQKAETCLFHATAAQRAEAFLKTLNLWRPDLSPDFQKHQG